MPSTSRNLPAAPGPDRPVRGRRALRLSAYAVILLLGLSLAGGLALFFTAGYWIPGAARWYAARKAGVRVEMEDVDFFPLGRLTVRNLRVGRSGVASDALKIGREEIVYARLTDLLRGKVTALDLEGVEIFEAEVFETQDRLRRAFPPAQPSSSGLAGSVCHFLANRSPQNLSVRDLKWNRASGKTYGLRHLSASRGTDGGAEIVLDLSFETEPLEEMALPVKMRGPLRLDGEFAFTAETFRVVRLETNLEDLINMRVSEGAGSAGAKGGFLNLEGTRADLDAWLRACDVSLPGELNSELRVNRLGFSKDAESGGWNARGEFGLNVEEWLDFRPQWGIRGLTDDLRAQVAVSPDFKKILAQTQHALRLETFDTPLGKFDDLKLDTNLETTWTGERLQLKQDLAFTGPGAGEATSEKLRLHLDGQLETNAVLGSGQDARASVPRRFPLSSAVSAMGDLRSLAEAAVDFDLRPRIAKGAAPPLEASAMGRFDYRRDATVGESFLALSSTGVLAGSAFRIEASSAFGGPSPFPPGAARAEITNCSLEEMEKAARLLDLPFPIALRGVANSRVGSRLDATGRHATSATLELAAFTVGMPGKQPFLSGPIDATVAVDASGGPAREDPIQIHHTTFEADGNIRSEGKGTVRFLSDRLVSRFEPVIRVQSLRRLGDRIRAPIPFEASAALSGSAEIETDYRGFLGRFDGETSLEKVSGDFPGVRDDAKSGKPQTPDRLRSFSAGRIELRGKSAFEQRSGAREASFIGKIGMDEIAFGALPREVPNESTSTSLALGKAEFAGKTEMKQNGSRRRFDLDGLFDLENIHGNTPAFGVHIEETSFSLSLASPGAFARKEYRTDLAFDLSPTSINLSRRFGGAAGRPTETQATVTGAGRVSFGPASAAASGAAPGPLALDAELNRFALTFPDGAKLEAFEPATCKGTFGAGNALALSQTFGLGTPDLPALLEQLSETGVPGVRTLLDPRGVRLASGGLWIRRGNQTLDTKGLAFRGILEPDALTGDVLDETVVWEGLSGLLAVVLKLPAPLGDLTSAALARLTAETSGTLRARGLTAYGADFQKLEMTLRSQTRKIFLDAVAFEAYGGEGFFTGEANLESSPPSFSMKMTIRNMNLDAFARDHPALKDVRLSGLADVEAVWRGEGERITLSSQVVQTSPKIYMDRVTAYKILVDNLKRIGLGSKVRDTEEALLKHYRGVGMIGFDRFEVAVRYDSADDTVRNTLRLECPFLPGYTYDVNYRAGDVLWAMRKWQDLKLRAKRAMNKTG